MAKEIAPGDETINNANAAATSFRGRQEISRLLINMLLKTD